MDSGSVVKRLSVLQVLPALEQGGVERGTLEIAAGLVAAGHRSIVASAGGRMVAPLIESGSEHWQMPIGRKSLRSLSLLRPLAQRIRAEQIDIIHARSRFPAWITWYARKQLDPPSRPIWITTIHGFYSRNRYSAIMAKGEYVIAVSDSIKQYAIDAFKLKPERLTVIPRGVDPDLYNPEFAPTKDWRRDFLHSLGCSTSASILTLPGRITRLKGHADFIHLLRRLLDAGHEVHGVIVGGEEPKRAAYAESMRELGLRLQLESHLSWLGHRGDLRDILAASDIVLSLSSKPESFGRTTLEALSLGRPVVGYDHGGVAEQLHALYPRGRVPPGDNDRLFETLVSQLDLPASVAPNTELTLQRMVSSTVDLYERAAAANTVSSR